MREIRELERKGRSRIGKVRRTVCLWNKRTTFQKGKQKNKDSRNPEKQPHFLSSL